MQNKPQIVNIINFIRDIEPRDPRDPDVVKKVLADTTRNQISLAKKYNLKTTFLLQYDSLTDPVYQEMLKELDPEQFEFGLWHEIVQPQCEKLGIPWTGRFPWDWHCHCGFGVGYTKEERRALLDLSFETFKEIFGYYPRVFGSWFFDSESLRYITRKYGLDACCNCKEQYGTDGYTLWGSYYGQAYYPSSTNIFMPAQTKAEQLDVPLFRMLGSDQVYQFDFGISSDAGADTCQGVITLEPVYTGSGGGTEAWVDWFLRENFNGECLTFGYAQAGQENSFFWDKMKRGLEYQFPLFAKLQAEGKITVEKFGETGRRYKQTYTETPASAITAHSAFDDDDKNSTWYCTKNYRINLYSAAGTIRIRDLHVFNENVADPFENTVCTANDATYETLPVIDGNVFSGNGILSGVYFKKADGTDFAFDRMDFADLGNGHARVTFGALTFDLTDDAVEITADTDFTMENRIGKTDSPHLPVVENLTATGVTLSYNGTTYGLTAASGEFTSATTVKSVNRTVRLVIENR